jgi:hypothetical protein
VRWAIAAELECVAGGGRGGAAGRGGRRAGRRISRRYRCPRGQLLDRRLQWALADPTGPLGRMGALRLQGRETAERVPLVGTPHGRGAGRSGRRGGRGGWRRSLVRARDQPRRGIGRAGRREPVRLPACSCGSTWRVRRRGSSTQAIPRRCGCGAGRSRTFRWRLTAPSMCSADAATGCKRCHWRWATG